MKAWLFQRTKGKGNPWGVQWRDLDGKLRQKQIGKKTYAERFRRQMEDELASALTGYVERHWKDFRKEYEEKKLAGLSKNTQVIYGRALHHFENECQPNVVGRISSRTIDEYIAARRKMPGALPGSTTSVVTINIELRTLKRVLNVAKRWNYLKEVPAIEFLREPKSLPTFISAEEFTCIYHACDVATLPNKIPMAYQPSDWWRAFLLFQFMTGMRVGEPLKLLREDVDLETGQAITRSTDNKAKTEARIPLHPVLIDHLKLIPGFTPFLFPWPQSRRTLWDEFRRIQKQAGIRKTCRKDIHT
jgi:integrase